MPSRELPARPNLEQLKKQAKSLLDAAKARDRDALRRFAILPSLSGKSLDADRRGRSGAARRAVGDRARARIPVLERAARRSRVAHAVVRGGRRRVHPLRDRRRDRPRGATSRAPSAHRVRDAAHGAGARRRRGGRGRGCKKHPELARQPGGPQDWEPLLYVCHTSMHKRESGRGSTDSSTIARRLCALGANPNARISLELASRTAADGTVGSGLRCRHTCRSPRCCSRRAPIRPTASRRTLPAAAATSMRSNC